MTAKTWEGPFKLPSPIDGTCIKCDLPGKYYLHLYGLQARCCLEHITEGLCSKEGGRTLAEAKKEIAEYEAERRRDANTHWLTWVPVEERLPEEGIEVMWFSPSGKGVSEYRFTGYRDGNAVNWGGDLDMPIDPGTSTHVPITHWMPLPPPPRATT